MRIAKVIVNLSLDRPFDYLVPDSLLASVAPGVMVYVPFGHSRRRGYVVGLKDESDYPADKLKSIEDVCGKHPRIPDKLLELGKWMAEYYCCAQEQATKALLPLAVRSGKIGHKTVRHYHVDNVIEAQKIIFENAKRAKKKIEVLKYLLQHPGASYDSVVKESGAGAAQLKALVKAGTVKEERRKTARTEFSEKVQFMPAPVYELTDEQKSALEKIAALSKDASRTNRTVLLHGITGSGKTEVYMRAIEAALNDGKDAIVLVPEISLTPQTTERFIARFGRRVSVLHSGLTDGERFDEWMKIFHGEVRIAVGARSALFAPFRNLGLIVVDEEHENSYKQDEAPRYHARDVSVMRGVMEKAVVILGSATPSLESYNNAMTGKYVLAKLTRRVDNCLLPKMLVVDMKTEMLKEARGIIFSNELLDAIRDRLRKKEQTIIFLNRRGFATQMACPHCGFVAKCSECDVSYIYHRKRECLSCHLCGAVMPSYRKCPECGAEDIRYSGVGTEKLEAILSKLFPTAAIQRMDSDSMGGRRQMYEKALFDFRSGKTDILVGTQMIAKGLHFPKVTLVGIVNADTSLHLADFRAAERTFQLLTQVAGRAGRGDIEGEVYVQTFSPRHPAIQLAISHGYEEFCRGEMEMRKNYTYPPCGHMIAVHFRGPDQEEIVKYADSLLEKMKPALEPGIITTGPLPSPIERIKGKYRYMILFRGSPLKALRARLRETVLHEKRPKDLDAYVDVDPMNLM